MGTSRVDGHHFVLLAHLLSSVAAAGSAAVSEHHAPISQGKGCSLSMEDFPLLGFKNYASHGKQVDLPHFFRLHRKSHPSLRHDGEKSTPAEAISFHLGQPRY